MMKSSHRSYPETLSEPYWRSQPDLHHSIYLKLPEGAEVPAGNVYKLVKSLYGLKQSGGEWHKELDAHLWRLGFFPLLKIHCVYLRGAGETQVTIMVYIDNMLIISLFRNQIDQVKRAIIDKWKITDNGPAKEFLKIKITRDGQNGCQQSRAWNPKTIVKAN
ncbi:uncharacterized protein UHOD_12356 [Ustilago sp. UG-2017b]|nr:uncharacterized protein UHOD_12356 [Ustilago sp. UG-2017b]